MILASKLLNPISCMEFQAHVYIYHVAATITERYQAVVHVGTLRQTCTLKINSKNNVLRGGDEADVTFRFIKGPEFVQIGSRLIFREGKTHGYGNVLSIIPFMS